MVVMQDEQGLLFYPDHRVASYIVRAECFTPEELELFALPCPGKTPSQKTAAANWDKDQPQENRIGSI